MTVKTASISLSTRGDADIQDITDKIEAAVRASGLTDGVAVVFCPSSTSALTTLEYEPGAVSDLKRLFDEIIAPDRVYQHNEKWHDGNGHSHVRAALLGASLSVPFTGKTLRLGTWQQVIYVDFDTRPRKRELVVQLLGE